MQKFNTLKSIPAYLPIVNIDTDMIIPKQFLKTIKRTGLGKNLFFEMRYDDNGNEIGDFILNQMNSGNGTLGKLLNDDNMYQNLEGATKQLEALLQDFKLNPERYIHVSVFGKKTKPYDAASNKENDN